MKYIITAFSLLFFVEVLFSLSNINSVITEFQLFEGQIWLLTVLLIFLIILYFVTNFLSTKEGKSKIHLFKAYIAIVLGVFIVTNILSFSIISDFKDISTSYLLDQLYLSLGKPNRLFYLPTSILKFLFVILGKGELISKLLCSLQADISYSKDTLKWKPPYTLEEGIEKTIKYFLKNLK